MFSKNGVDDQKERAWKGRQKEKKKKKKKTKRNKTNYGLEGAFGRTKQK